MFLLTLEITYPSFFVKLVTLTCLQITNVSSVAYKEIIESSFRTTAGTLYRKKNHKICSCNLPFPGSPPFSVLCASAAKNNKPHLTTLVIIIHLDFFKEETSKKNYCKKDTNQLNVFFQRYTSLQGPPGLQIPY